MNSVAKRVHQACVYLRFCKPENTYRNTVVIAKEKERAQEAFNSGRKCLMTLCDPRMQGLLCSVHRRWQKIQKKLSEERQAPVGSILLFSEDALFRVLLLNQSCGGIIAEANLAGMHDACPHSVAVRLHCSAPRHLPVCSTLLPRKKTWESRRGEQFAVRSSPPFPRS